MASGPSEDHHHPHVPHDLIVEANPRLDVWMLLQCGALVEGTTTRLRWGEKGCQLARQTPDIWIDGARVPVVWEEPMAGAGRLVYTLTPMSQDEAKTFNIPPESATPTSDLIAPRSTSRRARVRPNGSRSSARTSATQPRNIPAATPSRSSSRGGRQAHGETPQQRASTPSSMISLGG